MPAGRFVLLETPLARDAEIELPFEVAHQARDVLRLGVGGTLRLLDGAGGEYPAEVIEVEPQACAGAAGRARGGVARSACARHALPGDAQGGEVRGRAAEVYRVGRGGVRPAADRARGTRRGERGETTALARHPR